MKEIEITKKIYIAYDGKEFLNRNDCEKYENEVLETLKKIKYFEVKYNPDLTQTGCYRKSVYVAVYSPQNNWHYQILLQYIVIEDGQPILQEGVMGYGYMPGFEIIEIPKVTYFVHDVNDKKLLSPVEIVDFPKNIDYMKMWKLK